MRLDENTFEKDYKEHTSHLLYENISYEACIESLSRLQLFLEQHDI